MPLNANEEALLGYPSAEEFGHDYQRRDVAVAETKKIGRVTIVALILNRSIGSGIFFQPNQILAGTGCVGGALSLWVLAFLIQVCGVYVWLECGLGMPQKTVKGESVPRGVPRSGGEKNFLEFMFPGSPSRLAHFRTTCSFAVMFILMYNLTGNVISLAIQFLIAIGTYDPLSNAPPPQGPVVGVAIGTLTIVVLVHMFSRQGGLFINNVFAVFKIGLLIAIIVLGIAKACGAFSGAGNVPMENFTQGPFVTNRKDPASWSTSLVFCMYSFSGFKQPFYILGEIKSPRSRMPRYSIGGMLLLGLLFIMVNISYLLIVPKSLVIPATADEIPQSIDMGTLFFSQIFPNAQHVRQAMAALVFLSLCGNVVVMTFTAARVKQEIAKEGILPWSLVFAASYRTPHGLLKKWLSGNTIPDKDIERAPTAAFCLHWMSSVFLLLVTLAIKDPRQAYNALVSLYTFTIVLLLGFWVSFGLIRTKLIKEPWCWQERRRYRPWLSPYHAIVYCAVCGLLIAMAFVPPAKGSPFHSSVTGFPWWIVPTIGLTAPLWGIVYSFALQIYGMFRRKTLVVDRISYWGPDPDCPSEYIQTAEVVECVWQEELRGGRGDREYGFSQSEEEKAPTVEQQEIGIYPYGNSRNSPAFVQRDGQPRMATTSDGRMLDTGF